MCLRAEEEGIVVNPDGITNSYDAFGNVFVSGNTETKNPYTYNVIIPGLSEPPVRTLRATIPENESHIFR